MSRLTARTSRRPWLTVKLLRGFTDTLVTGHSVRLVYRVSRSRPGAGEGAATERHVGGGEAHHLRLQEHFQPSWRASLVVGEVSRHVLTLPSQSSQKIFGQVCLVLVKIHNTHFEKFSKLQ